VRRENPDQNLANLEVPNDAIWVIIPASSRKGSTSRLNTCWHTAGSGQTTLPPDEIRKCSSAIGRIVMCRNVRRDVRRDLHAMCGDDVRRCPAFT
jgi:hypothetical protein